MMWQPEDDCTDNVPFAIDFKYILISCIRFIGVRLVFGVVSAAATETLDSLPLATIFLHTCVCIEVMSRRKCFGIIQLVYVMRMLPFPFELSSIVLIHSHNPTGRAVILAFVQRFHSATF